MEEKNLKREFRKRSKQNHETCYSYILLGVVVTIIGFISAIMTVIFTKVGFIKPPTHLALLTVSSIFAVVGIMLYLLGEIILNRNYKQFLYSKNINRSRNEREYFNEDNLEHFKKSKFVDDDLKESKKFKDKYMFEEKKDYDFRDSKIREDYNDEYEEERYELEDKKSLDSQYKKKDYDFRDSKIRENYNDEYEEERYELEDKKSLDSQYKKKDYDFRDSKIKEDYNDEYEESYELEDKKDLDSQYKKKDYDFRDSKIREDYKDEYEESYELEGKKDLDYSQDEKNDYEVRDNKVSEDDESFSIFKYNFKYDEGYNGYRGVINDVEIIIGMITPKIEDYVSKLVFQYNNNIDAIVEFMIGSEAFDSDTGMFKGVNKKILKKSLNSPTIRIISEDLCEISYLNHTLDDTTIISFQFSGVYERMMYLTFDD